MLRWHCLFRPQESVAAAFPKAVQQMMTVGEDLRREDIQNCSLHNYDLTFAFYSKFPSWGFVQARGPRKARTLVAPCSYQSVIPSRRLLFVWWQYKISWIYIKALDILRNGHFSWEHLWRLSCFNYRWVFRLTCFLSLVHLWGCLLLEINSPTLWSKPKPWRGVYFISRDWTYLTL